MLRAAARDPVSDGQASPTQLLPASAAGLVLPLAAPSPPVSLARHVQPGPARGADPLIRRSKASDAMPLLEPVWHRPPWAVRCPHPPALRPERRRAAGAGLRPASVGRCGWRSQPAAHGPFVAPAVSATASAHEQWTAPVISAPCLAVSARQDTREVSHNGRGCDLYPPLLYG